MPASSPRRNAARLPPGAAWIENCESGVVLAVVLMVLAALSLMAEGSPVGRKLDFLAQEFAREANTLCSKASDNELTRIGLDLKAAIDQMREQIQNVE